jgi:hypothetical protein
MVVPLSELSRRFPIRRHATPTSARSTPGASMSCEKHTKIILVRRQLSIGACDREVLVFDLSNVGRGLRWMIDNEVRQNM